MNITEDLDAAQQNLKKGGRQDDEPPAPDPAALASGGRTIPAAAANDKTTAYHVVVNLLGEIPVDESGVPSDAAIARLRNGHTPGVPFILGGWESPEVFEVASGPSGAKRAALAAHPELAACVREPGIALATWPARSYQFKRVEVEAQPDKLIV